MDEIDRTVVRALHDDPRATNKALARIAGISEPAIAARIRRMIAGDVLRFTLQQNALRQGYRFQAFVYVAVKGRRVVDVAADIWSTGKPNTVICIQGKADILVVLNCRDADDVSDFVDHALSGIAGIQTVEIDLTLRFLKYETHLAGLGP